MIYLDNAATTFQKPEEVVKAVAGALNSMGNSGRGAHEAALGASRVIYETREKLAELFGVKDARQIVFTANSTESLNVAIQGLLGPDDHVITTVMEHNSVLRPLYRLEEQGMELSIAGCDSLGNLFYDDIERQIKDSTKAVICTHASNLTGNMVDITRVGEICRKNHLLFIVDASQTAGVFPIDVEAMHIDVLCFTGHKGLLGPQGTGGMYVREGIVVKPLKTGGSGVLTYERHHPAAMPTALEAGTLNGHGIAGLGAALDYINKIGIDEIYQKEKLLMERFYAGVSRIKGIKTYGDFSVPNRAAIVALNLGEYDSAEVSDELFVEYQISTRPGAHCAPLMHKALGTVKQGVVRFSFSHYNTEEEVDAAVRALKELAEE